MKKEDVSGLLVYLVIFAIAIVFGLTTLRTYSQTWSNGGLFFLYVIGAIVAGIVVNAILFELAHLLGAKLGKYDVISVNILGFCFLKKQEKKFKFSSFDGLTGETKILAKNEKSNPTPYLLFGSLFFLVEFIGIVIAFIALNNTGVKECKDVAYFLLIVGVLGAMMEIYNIMPFQLDVTTDGYRLKLVSNPKNKIAFNELLKIKHAVEIGDTNVEIMTFTEITNFTADLNLNKVYLLLDKGEFDEAEKLLDIILAGKDGVSYKVYLRAKAQKIYIHLINGNTETITEYYEKEVPVAERREISTDVSMASIRAYILMSGLLDKSRSETELALANVLKAFKKTPKNRQQTEVKLFNQALNKVIETHPTWGLEGYLLQEVEKKSSK